MKISYIIYLLLSVLVLISCRNQNMDHSHLDHSRVSESEIIKGIYGNPESLMKMHPRLSDLGINAVFARKSALTTDLYDQLRHDSIKIFIEFPLLNGKEYLKDHPEAWPINEKGEKAPPADWFMGICVTDSGFIQSKRDELEDFLGKNEVDGVWLDYLHWHAQFETPEPILPETCFCNRCINLFKSYSELEIPKGSTAYQASFILKNHDKEWRKWRASIITNVVREFRDILKKNQENSLLGLYYCPWYPHEYDSALYRTLGLDMQSLDSLADVLTPMVYHQKMGRSPFWVKEYIDWISDKTEEWGTGTEIWPIVQAHNDPGIITPEEFRSVMEYGLSGNSSGVMMFSVYSLTDDSLKVVEMKDLYRQFRVKN